MNTLKTKISKTFVIIATLQRTTNKEIHCIFQEKLSINFVYKGHCTFENLKKNLLDDHAKPKDISLVKTSNSSKVGRLTG